MRILDIVGWDWLETVNCWKLDVGSWGSEALGSEELRESLLEWEKFCAANRD